MKTWMFQLFQKLFQTPPLEHPWNTLWNSVPMRNSLEHFDFKLLILNVKKWNSVGTVAERAKNCSTPPVSYNGGGFGMMINLEQLE